MSAPSVAIYHERPAQIVELTPFQQRVRQAELCIETLIERTKGGDFWSPGFGELQELLGALPLPTGAFLTTTAHLNNAWNYCRRQEYGAAAFELRIVRGAVQRL